MSEDEELREAGSRGKLEEEGLVKKSVEKIKKYITRKKRENKCLCESPLAGYN